MRRYARNVFVVLFAFLAAGQAVAAPGATSNAQDALNTLRQQAELARQRTVPPPPAGVIELQWQELSPAGWNPKKTLDRLGVAALEDDDPRAPAIMAEIRREWEQAPAVNGAPAKPVRMLGFPVMPDNAAGNTRQVILAPYYGACMHNPTPAANQMVLVTLRDDMPRSMYQYPVWITGKLQIKNSSTRQGRVAYSMADAIWEAYPFKKYPMPQYQWPR